MFAEGFKSSFNLFSSVMPRGFLVEIIVFISTELWFESRDSHSVLSIELKQYWYVPKTSQF